VTQAYGANPLRNQRTGQPRLQLPRVAQTTMAITSPMKNRPTGPSVYRPQSAAKTVQARTVKAAQNGKPPVAPAVYRPQPGPRVLQKKSDSVLPASMKSPGRPVASPAYRPQSKKIVQPKMTAAAQGPRSPKAPPVYRPQPTPKVLQGKAARPQQARPNQTKRATVAPPVYRPQPIPKVLQKKAKPGSAAGTGAGRRAPVAPPVYRPNNSPRVLQRQKKGASNSGGRIVAANGGNQGVAGKTQTQSRQPFTAGSGLRGQKSGGGIIQPKIGFELEIPVTFVTDKGENVDGKQTYLNGPYFKIVGDKSGNAGQMKGIVDQEEVLYNPTILEVVTHPIDEHAEGAQEKLQKTISAIEMLHFDLFLLTNDYAKPITVSELAKLAKLDLVLPEAKDYIINAPTATPRKAKPDSAYLHCTVGVSTASLLKAGEMAYVKGGAKYPGDATHQDAGGVFTDLKPFFLKTVGAFKEKEEYDKEDHEQVRNFLYLAYVHVRAIDRASHESTQVPGGGTKKNYTPLLSRATFYSIFNGLSKNAQKFIKTYDKELKGFLESHLHQAPKVQAAQEYLDDIFSYKPFPQSKYFGGMLEKPPERTGAEQSGLTGPPVEIRALGTALDEEGVRQKIGEMFEASKTQFTDTTKKSPFSMDMEYVTGINLQNILAVQ